MSNLKKRDLKKAKVKNQEEFGDKKDKAKEMYANAPVFKALMYVALPGILISFMQGMFIFADQIMMVNLIPKAGAPSMQYLMQAYTSVGNYAINLKNFLDVWNYAMWQFCQTHKGIVEATTQIEPLSIDSIVRFTVSLITPGLYILNAITILVGMGTAVNFSKAISVRDKLRAYDAWSTGVISTIVFSLCSSSIIIGVAQAWVTQSAGSSDISSINATLTKYWTDFQSVKLNVSGKSVSLYSFLFGLQSGLPHALVLTYPRYGQFAANSFTVRPLTNIEVKGSTKIITTAAMSSSAYSAFTNIYVPYYHHYHAIAIYWAQFYLRVDAGFNILACFNQYFSLMIRAEGRQFFPAFLATVANAMNIVLDYVFIYIIRMGVFGSVTAMVLGWAFNVLLFIVYIGIMSQKNNIVTYLKFSKVRARYFSWDLLWLAIGVGIGASIWNAGIAIQGTLQDILLSSATTKTGIPVAPSYYVELNGAMLPIVNLIFNALYGLVQGVTALVAYSYGARRYDRVKKEYWLTLLVAVVYGLFMYLVVGFGINKYLLEGFNITQGIPSPFDAALFLNRAEYFLTASMLQILVYAFAMSGILLFQALGKVTSTVISCAFQGFVFSFVALYMMLAIAGAIGGFNGMDAFLYGLPIDSAMSALVVLVWSAGYLGLRLGKPTRLEISRICKNLLKTDFSVPVVKASSPALALKSLVVCEK